MKKALSIIRIIIGLLALLFIYFSIVAIRFDDLSNIKIVLSILLDVGLAIIAIYNLQYSRANYPLFRWALPVILLFITVGIALTISAENAWVL